MNNFEFDTIEALMWACLIVAFVADCVAIILGVLQ